MAGALLSGTRARLAIEHIRARANRAASTAVDGRKLGLIVEGGAMRGVFSAGADISLETAGLSRSFDAVYASSAGALNAAYLLAGQAELGATVYYEDLDGDKFINYRRPQRILDLDYLFDEIIATRKPLDIDAVLASPTRFKIALTDAQSGQGMLVEAGAEGFDLLDTLRASATHPLLSERHRTIGGRVFFDGGLCKLLPIQDAIHDGCTDLLVILTRPRHYVEPAPNFLLRQWFTWRCARGNEAMRQAGLASHHSENAARDLATGRIEAPAGVNIAAICPDADLVLSQTERNAVTLRTAARRGAEQAARALTQDIPSD
jgi:predicted patatin/cPLA2 family phospholipase